IKSLLFLFGDRDRFAEERQAVDEEAKTDRTHHQELTPDRAHSSAAIDNYLRKTHEMPRWQKVGEILQPSGLALDWCTPTRKKHQHQSHQNYQQRELRHRT